MQKSILAISLFVGIALCNSTAFYGWVPHKELIYRFESEVMTGIPEIESQYSGLKLASDVKVQTFDDYSIRIQLENPRFIIVNQKLMVREGRPLIPKPEEPVPEHLRRHLSAPFVVHLKRGVVEELFVEQDEPIVVTNIKKALLSQLQMDLSASRRPEVVSNYIPKDTSLTGQVTNYFSTFESTVMGDCETSYTINPIPGYQAKEIEERMKVSEHQLLEEGIIAGEKSEGEEACRGKQYWEVVKTKNFNNCKEIPVYQSASGIKLKCDLSKAECNDAFTHTSSTRYVLCGSSPEEFYIRESITESNVLTNPLGWIASKEKMTSISRVTINLLKVKSSGFSPLPKPVSGKREHSIIFQYPRTNLWSSNGATKALTPEEESNTYGLESLVSKPDLHSASPLFITPLPVSELKEKISRELQKVVREIFKSPESCSSKSDIAGSVSAISFYLRPLSLNSLKEVERSLHAYSLTPEKREIAQELFLDILSMTGTNPATMLIKEKIERQDLPERVIVKVLQSTIRNIKTPTKELLRELLKLVKSLESKKHLYSIGLIQLSNLVNRACVDSDSQTTNFPVRIYGLFCKEDSEFVTREYIPYLVQKLHQSPKESEKLVIISALGKVGQREILLPLVKIIEESHSMSPMGRSVTVYMLKRLAKNEPSLVKPILLALIDNPAESTEVRIAAVSVLPWTQPSVAELQKIAVRSWFEPSKQVASFIYSTLKNIVHTEIPELKSVGEKAKGLLKTVKPFQYGIQFSKNTHTKRFVDFLRSASNVEITFVGTEDAYTPSRVSLSSRLFGGSWEIDGLTFGIYTKGMDSLIDSLWQKLGYKSEVSQQVKEQLERIGQQLNIKKRQHQSPASVIYFGLLGYDRVYSLDKDIYNEMIQKVTEELHHTSELFNNGHSFNYTHAKYVIDLDAVGPTDSGFPVITTRNVPFVAGIKGHVQAEGKFGEKSTLRTKIIPVINSKMQTNMGVVSPFTKEIVGAGVEASIHLTLPLTFKSIMTRTGSLELSLESPEEIQHQFEVLHAFVKPYTVRKRIELVEPISKSKHVKTILSMPDTQKLVKPVGESLGLKGILTVETDYPTPYFASIWNLIKKHNFVSLISLPFPSSIKYSSFKLEYNPVESPTKEIQAVISTVYGEKEQSSVPVVSYPSKSELSMRKEVEIEQICRERHPVSSQKVKLCKEQLEKRTIHNKEVHERTIRLLEQTSSGVVSGLSLEASLRSQSSHHTVNTALLVSGEVEGYKILGSGEVVFSAPSLPKYEVKVNGEVELPANGYRWSIDPLIEQPIGMSTKLVTRYGPVGEVKKELNLEAKLYKSENQKRSVKESVEMEKCRSEMLKGRGLSSICEEVRHQASSANKLEVRASFPEELAKSWVADKVMYGLASELYPLITVEESSVQSYSGQNNLKLTTEISRSGSVAQAWIEVPSYKIELRNITVPRPIKGLFPLSLRNSISTRLIQDVSRDQAPASCRLDTLVSTFDNKTYEYELNECQHLLFKDCSSYPRTSPLAVLAKNTGGSKKEVKIISSRSIVELFPSRPGLIGQTVYVKVDGQEVPVPYGSPYIQRSPLSDSKILLKIYRTRDGVVAVHNPVEGLEVFYDGKRIEIVAPQLLRNRACGLCGDLNGENTADLKSPEECIMSTPRLAALSYILEEGHCSGIPSLYREQYRKDKSQCIKKHTIPTPLMKLSKALLMNKVKQESLVHVVEVQKNQICISKSPVRSCPKSSRPESTKPIEVSFACLVRTYSRAQQILKRVKAGEIIPEVLELPTAFTKKQYVPTRCSKPSYSSHRSISHTIYGSI